MSGGLVRNDAMQIGDAVYRPSDRAIQRGGEEQRLEPKQAGVLDLLAQHAGKVVSRDTLLDSVWGDEGSDEALTQAISRLRQSLGNRELIRTEPRQGYRLTVQPAVADANLYKDVAVEPQGGGNLRFDMRALKIAFGLGLATGLLLSLIVALALWPSPVTITEEISQPPDGPPTTTLRHCEGSSDECEAVLSPQS